MCGIAGIIQTAPVYTTAELEKMTAALAHRGPQGIQCWQNPDSRALMGHCRLSVIDLSNAASQPMQYADQDRYSIVHNGEIYNYIELRKQLETKGYKFRTQSDTEVILAAYDHWNFECVEHFDGMFAFAIWDDEEKMLFAARDRFGEKPFFYSYNGEQLLFASEMKAIWAAGIERTPNLKMLFNFITIGYTDNPARTEETFFENIFRLPPASRLQYWPALNDLTIDKYWDIDPEYQAEDITDKEAQEQFKELLTVSVQRRLRSDVTIGTSLSGGLDSSSIIAVMSGLYSGNSLNAFTAGFSGFEKDETAFAKQVAASFNLSHHVVELTAAGLVDDWEKLIYHQEEPIGSASVYAQYKVFELAKAHNVTVLLDGQGADEILAGYHKYYKWYWQELFQKRRLMRSRELRAAKDLGVKEKFGMKNVIASVFPELASVILERQYLVHALAQEDLNRDFVKLQSKEAYYTTPDYSGLNGQLYFNTCMHGLEELLRYADRNSMAHGREVRLPFLSHKLVEFVFSLPSHFKIRNGWTKWLLRKTIENKLPDTITWRKDKTGFEPPQQSWMGNKKIQDMVYEARKKLVAERILNDKVMDKPVEASGSHSINPFDWRYLAAAAYLK
jgi:asparagine synthase (glutamine-hydrolysing)